MVRNAEIHCSIIRNSKLENIIFIDKNNNLLLYCIVWILVEMYIIMV